MSINAHTYNLKICLFGSVFSESVQKFTNFCHVGGHEYTAVLAEVKLAD